MKISVIGSGAMGSLYGGMLALSGNDVILYDINVEHINAVSTKGLIIEELEKEGERRVHPGATTDPAAAADSEILIVFVKSTATETVARQFAPLVSSEATVITLQNGVGNEEILRKHFGEDRTAAGVTSQGATFLGPGKIRHAGSGPTHLCMSSRKNEKLKSFVSALNKAGFETRIEENIENLIWSKLIINVGINALTALTGLHNGNLLDYSELKEIMKELVNEAVRVTEAKKISLTYDEPLSMVFTVCEKTAGNRSSMLQDFDRKVQSEIDFINNAIVREGEKLKIPTPVNKTVGGLVKIRDKIHASKG